MQPTGPSAEPMKHLVCRECSWKTERTDFESRESADRAAIDHYVATGHSIEVPDEAQSDGARNAAAAAVRCPSDD